MFDPSDLSGEQKDALLEYVRKASNDPIHMFTLKVMQKFLPIEEWIKKNDPKNLKEFQTMWEGIQNQVQSEAKNFETDLLRAAGALDV